MFSDVELVIWAVALVTSVSALTGCLVLSEWSAGQLATLACLGAAPLVGALARPRSIAADKPEDAAPVCAAGADLVNLVNAADPQTAPPYQRVLNLLVEEQGDWFVEYMLAAELGRVLTHKSKYDKPTDSDSEDDDSDSEGDDSDSEGSDDGSVDGRLEESEMRQIIRRLKRRARRYVPRTSSVSAGQRGPPNMASQSALRCRASDDRILTFAPLLDIAPLDHGDAPADADTENNGPG